LILCKERPSWHKELVGANIVLVNAESGQYVEDEVKI